MSERDEIAAKVEALAKKHVPLMERFFRLATGVTPYEHVFAILGPVRGDKQAYALVTLQSGEAGGAGLDRVLLAEVKKARARLERLLCEGAAAA